MFVSIQHNADQSIYECDRIHVVPNESKILIHMERDGRPDAITHEIDKDDAGDVGVYVLNNAGKTIDTLFRKVGGSR